ncbi:MAG: nicotinate (nicotinamide) nucleotide adenylyltransferase [Chthonomonadaceae bacterium]|nr:nicotinate (nicotinamide) nucleotide adenylyltransferase [Chthonomonadaceae bacterium]
MKTAILGGSFDPPHNGHIDVAKTVLNELGLDEVLFVPASANPLKPSRTHPKTRLKMVELAVSGEEGLSVCDIEVTRGGPSYTYETLSELRLARPANYWLVLGSDALKSFDRWSHPEKVMAMSRLAVVPRDGDDIPSIIRAMTSLPDLRHVVDVVPMEPVKISSTLVRNHIRQGFDVQSWIKPAVWEYIKDIGLYR